MTAYNQDHSTGFCHCGLDQFIAPGYAYCPEHPYKQPSGSVYTNGPIPVRDVAGEWDRRAEEGPTEGHTSRQISDAADLP